MSIYKTWYSIHQKCYNENNDNYIYYGDRGIKICNEWKNYDNFKSWSLSTGYKDNLILSRKDINLGYSPSNCEWITEVEHKAKRGKTGKVEYIEYQGIKLTLAELSKVVNISFNTLRSRYLSGRRGESLWMKPNKGLKVII